ncbi:MAG: acetylornithine/succinyldiaminopimelate transaminase, partial [Gammaproteobacteria bacterium]
MTSTAAEHFLQDSKTLIGRELYDRVMTPNYAPMTMIPERGEGARLWDTEGKEYLDFAAGIAVSALGHAHPELCRVLAEQAGKFWHVSNLLTNKPAIELAHRLCELTFAERVFFANSGAEANEAGLKLARRYALDHFGEGKTEIISFNNSFHGRTFFTVCVGGQQKYSEGFGPKPGDITHLPFNDIDALKGAVSDRTCAIIFEPVQGEGGVNPATEEFVRTARALCDQFNACLIFDEVQIGMGRSGHLFTYQKLGIAPDILTSAKGLGGGFPIGAMLTTEAIADSLKVGTHGSTFGGNPMACAVACKVLEIVSSPELLGSVARKSDLLKHELEKLNQKYDLFAEVRGDGLLLGCELSEKWKGRARDILTRCAEQGLLILMAGNNVLRLAPPLIVEDGDIVGGVAIMEKAIKSL